jgi:hypothetical protein
MSNTNHLSLADLEALATKLSAHHPDCNVKISYHVSGHHTWDIYVSNKGQSKVYSLPSFAERAIEELTHIAEHGIDFSKEDAQL